MNSQTAFPRTFSLELFPPKTAEGFNKLKDTVASFRELGAAYMSVTYGAGGSTRERTFATVDWLLEEGIEVAPHLSCIGGTRSEISKMLERYRARGIRRVVALRGDLPSGVGLGGHGELRYASDLVRFIREQTGDYFSIEVAAYPEFHPQARNAETDLGHFVNKVRAGANGAITQYFFNADAYFSFVSSCEKRGLEIPIVPGIMPINNFTQLARFSDACGAEIPRWIRKRLEGYGDDTTSIRRFGVEVVTTLCSRLLDGGAPGLHFYTMNQSGSVLQIWRNLGLPITRSETSR